MQRSGDPASLGAAPVLACDLDGTVVSVNTFPHFVLFSLWRLLREGRLEGWCRLVVALLRRKLLRASHNTLKEVVHDVSLLMSADAVRGWARRLLVRRGRPEVVALLEGWDGSTVLCTAAPQPYASHFGDLLRMDLVQGSTRSRGRFVENVSTEKATRLAGVLPGPLECAITDDPDIDCALLALARRRLVVAPTGVVADI